MRNDTLSAADWFVVVECSSRSLQVQAERVVMTLDPHAVRTYATEVSPLRARRQ